MIRPTVKTLILHIDNEFGVLARVTDGIRTEGWNIISLVVAETMNPAISRLTISMECKECSLPQLVERLNGLDCVRSVAVFADETHFSRELMLVTIGCAHVEWALQAAEAIGAQVLDQQNCGCLTLEFTGTFEQAENLLAALRPYGIVNVARSGVVTLERPAKLEE